MFSPLDKYIYRSYPHQLTTRKAQKKIDYCRKCLIASLAFFLFCVVYVYDLSGLMLAQQSKMQHDLCWTSNDPMQCVDPTYTPHYREGAVIPKMYRNNDTSQLAKAI